MPTKTAYKEYKQVQVNTANRKKLLIMLYQGCIKFLRLAKKNIEEENIEEANNYLIRSQDIILELMNTLDHEKGGELADRLYNLYDFMNRQLLQANIKKKVEPIEIVEDMMMELLGTWNQALNGQNQNQSQANVNVQE